VSSQSDQKRPFDPVIGAAILRAMESGKTLDEACDEAGVSRRVARAWDARGSKRSMSPEGEWRRALLKVSNKQIFRRHAKPARDDERFETGGQITPIVDERVRRVASMMAEGNWYNNRSKQALVEEWGLSFERVSQIAAEANRLVRFSTDDQEQIDQLRTTHLARLEKIGQEAEADGKHRDAISAIRVQGELAGTIRQGNMTNMQILTLVMESSEFREWLERDLVPHLCPDCVRKAYRATGGDVVDVDE